MANGKGDKARPKNREFWERHYERIFNKKKDGKAKDINKETTKKKQI